VTGALTAGFSSNGHFAIFSASSFFLTRVSERSSKPEPTCDAYYSLPRS
jgi:hypothetical protein